MVILDSLSGYVYILETNYTNMKAMTVGEFKARFSEVIL